MTKQVRFCYSMLAPFGFAPGYSHYQCADCPAVARGDEESTRCYRCACQRLIKECNEAKPRVRRSVVSLGMFVCTGVNPVTKRRHSCLGRSMEEVYLHWRFGIEYFLEKLKKQM